MSPPRPVNPGNDRASKAPYNFVPLAAPVYQPEDPLPDHGQYLPERLSGQIEITLRTETWLYTRSAVPPDQAVDDVSEAVWEKDSPYRDFFHHGDPSEPVVPGSSLRGMLRQLVEVLSDGRLDTAPTDPIVYRAVADTTRFGWYYKRRFVGPNTDPRNKRSDGRANPNPTGLPQQLEYPVRVPDGANPWKRYAVHGGYLFREGRHWYIRPAKRLPAGSEETFVHVDAANLPARLQPWHTHIGEHPVWVVPAPRSSHPHPKMIHGHIQLLTLDHAVTDQVWDRPQGSRPPGPQAVPAILVITDSLRDREGKPNKHMHCAILEPDLQRRIEVPPELQRLYLKDRAISRADSRTGRLLPTKPPLESQGGERVPCFYMVDEKGALVFFGGTLFFRLPYEQAPSNFQNAPGAPDLASHLFGTLNGADGRPIKGRVRFEDLARDRTQGPPDPFVGIRYPEPLLAPKPACIQHYLVQPSDRREELLHYDDRSYRDVERDGEVTALRGFKHYWHRNDPEQPERVVRAHAPDLPPPDSHRTRTVVRPVKEGVVFSGWIHFDNLSPVELGALLVALDLTPTLRHKLGMARPFGFGSVKIERKQTRVLDPSARYGSFFSADGPGENDTPDAPSKGTWLQPGWRPDSDAVARAAKKAFCTELASFRGSSLSTDATEDEVTHQFWASHRMRDLAALLEWDRRPDWEDTAPVSVPNPQWRERRVLPPPSALMRRPLPHPDMPARREQQPTKGRRPPAEPATTRVAQALQDAVQRQQSHDQPHSTAEPVREGQDLTGTLSRQGSSWVAILDGDTRRAKILNRDTIPKGTKPGSRGHFRVKRVQRLEIRVVYEGPAE